MNEDILIPSLSIWLEDSMQTGCFPPGGVEQARCCCSKDSQDPESLSSTPGVGGPSETCQSDG